MQTPAVERLLRKFPVVVITGARQTGKTTLVQHLPSASGRRFRTLDDPVTADLARRDPETLLGEAPRIALDEVQRRPELLLLIKRLVDRNRVAGRFLLTGSANLLLMAGVSESLAGRAAYVQLPPLTESEKAGTPARGTWGDLVRARTAEGAAGRLASRPVHDVDWRKAVVEGGFPSAALEHSAERRRSWFDAYVQTYVERDLRQLSMIADLADFRRLMRVAALRVGCLVNQADLARDAGLSHATAHRYLNLLETSYLMARVPQYSVSRTKRLLKMPKLYWGDTGLVAWLGGIEDARALAGHDAAGRLLENLVWHHLRCATGTDTEVLTWRTVQGEEVDFVLESRRGLLPVEVKAARQVGSDDLRGLESFLDEHRDRARLGVVVYNGAECRLLTRRILALPLGLCLGL